MLGRRIVMPAVMVSLISGCAMNVPRMQRAGEKPEIEWARETDIVNHVKCELRQAVILALNSDTKNQENIPLEDRATWMKKWGAKVTLKLVIEDKAVISPGLSITDPLENAVKVFSKNGNVTVARNKSVGLGASYTSDVTRTDTVGFYYPFVDLIAKGPAAKDLPPGTDTGKLCGPIEGFAKDDDLDIENFMMSKIYISQQKDVLFRKPGTSPYDVFSYEVSFVVTTSANVTPGWKLARVAVMPTGTFFNGQRVRTNDLTISMGPPDDHDPTQPSRAVQDAHLVSQIEAAFRSALDSRQP